MQGGGSDDNYQQALTRKHYMLSKSNTAPACMRERLHGLQRSAPRLSSFLTTHACTIPTPQMLQHVGF